MMPRSRARWPLPSAPATPTISPARTSDGDRTEAQTLELVHVEQRLLAGRGETRRELQLGGSSHHQLHDLVDLPPFGAERALDLAVAEHGQTVGKPTDLLESVADVDDGRAGVARLLDDLLELSGKLHVQSGCRLVEHQHLRTVRHGPCDLEDLPGARAETGDDVGLLERQREAVQDLGQGRWAAPARWR